MQDTQRFRVPVVESEANGKPIETVEEGRPATPEPLPPIPPAQRVVIRGGPLWHGITEAQADKLVRMCYFDRARFNQAPEKIRSEIEKR